MLLPSPHGELPAPEQPKAKTVVEEKPIPRDDDVAFFIRADDVTQKKDQPPATPAENQTENR